MHNYISHHQRCISHENTYSIQGDTGKLSSFLAALCNAGLSPIVDPTQLYLIYKHTVCMYVTEPGKNQPSE